MCLFEGKTSVTIQQSSSNKLSQIQQEILRRTSVVLAHKGKRYARIANEKDLAAQAGGIWVNLGPLLYHWADAHTYLPGEELSIELSLEDVEEIVQHAGFQTLHRSMVPASFNTNIR